MSRSLVHDSLGKPAIQLPLRLEYDTVGPQRRNNAVGGGLSGPRLTYFGCSRKLKLLYGSRGKHNPLLASVSAAVNSRCVYPQIKLVSIKYLMLLKYSPLKLNQMH